jgi:uncharacterized protein (TIGR02246 family)
MKRSIIAGVASLALATGLASAAAAQDATAVQDLANRWTSAYNSHDAAVLGQLYAEDAKLFLHGSPSYEGRQAIEEFWAEDMQVENPLTVLTVTHAVDGVDMKLVHGDYQVIDRSTGVPLGAGRFAHIWTLAEGGAWMLDRDLWNQPFTPVAAPE